MSLKDAARKIIVDDMFRPLHIRGEWKVSFDAKTLS